MIVIGLTGSIATGKTTVARMLGFHGLPVFDADQAVHAMMQPGSDAFEEIQTTFPKAIKNGQVDRKTLGKIVFNDEAKRQPLEAILHPRVRVAEHHFIEQGVRDRRDAIVMDIPLLYETGAEALCDLVLVTYCPPFMQYQRAMKRPGMTDQKLDRIINSQMSQDEKLRRADWVIETSLGKAHSMREVKHVLKELGVA